MIASARMYEWTPSLSATWRRLLAWAAARARVDLEIVENRSVSLDATLPASSRQPPIVTSTSPRWKSRATLQATM